MVFSASVAARLLMAEPGPGAATGAGEVTGLGSVAATLAVAVVGATAALALKVPAGAQIGPMVLGSLLHASGLVRMSLPVPILELAYACIGWYVGLRFTRETLRLTVTALPGILTATFAVIALCAGWAYLLTLLLPIDLLTAVLATSPGGLDSVAIIAVGSQADVSFVLAVQTLRLFVVLLTGPLLAKWISRTVPEGAPPVKALWLALLNSLRGLKYGARTERAIQQELALLALGLPLAFVIGTGLWVRVALVASLLLMLAAEFLNTAIEKLCDHVEPGHHAKIGIVKDLASAGTFMAQGDGAAGVGGGADRPIRLRRAVNRLGSAHRSLLMAEN